MATDLTDVLVGAVDLHRHGYPEISERLRTPLSDVDDVRLCRDAGMAATVLKSHTWPTTGRAQLIEQAVPGIRVVPSVTLNHFAGGMRPEIIELAARQGARVVYLPTAGARSDILRGGISQRIAGEITHYHPDPDEGVVVTNDDGELTEMFRKCLDVLDEWPMLVYSGHLSAPEALAILRDGRLRDRFVLSHPDSHSIGASDSEVVTAAGLGAYIEICALGVHPKIDRVTPADLARTVRAVGAERCVITSDYFFPWSPPSSVTLHEFAVALFDEGITRDELDLMLKTNPRRLIGLTGDE